MEPKACSRSGTGASDILREREASGVKAASGEKAATEETGGTAEKEMGPGPEVGTAGKETVREPEEESGSLPR